MWNNITDLIGAELVYSNPFNLTVEKCALLQEPK